jgi:hypothetical protein
MTIEFTEQQLGHIMQVLAQRPYAEVCDLITHIHRQASQQAQQQQARPQAGEPLGLNGSGQPAQ